MLCFERILWFSRGIYENGINDINIMSQINAVLKFYNAYALSCSILEINGRKVLYERTVLFRKFLMEKKQIYLLQLKKMMLIDINIINDASNKIRIVLDKQNIRYDAVDYPEDEPLAIAYEDDD